MEENIWKKTHSSVKGPTVGIDFGTSNSCVAIWRPDKKRVKVIKNRFKLSITESSIQFPFNNFVDVNIGLSETDATSPSFAGDIPQAPIIREVKCLLGTPLGALGGDVWCTNGGGESRLISGEILCAHILSALRMDAQNYVRQKKSVFQNNNNNNKWRKITVVGRETETDDVAETEEVGEEEGEVEVRKVVIGVPAVCSSLQRLALTRAAHSAGFTEVGGCMGR